MTVFLSLIVRVLGGLIYRFAASAKTARLGEIAFAVGLLIFLWLDSSKAFTVFAK
jgi:hypothetical protein